MVDVNTSVDQIRKAVYGKDVRESIASGIEAINAEVVDTTEKQESLDKKFDDVVANATSGSPSNVELVAARTSGVTGARYDTIGKRIDANDSLLAGTAKQVDVNALNTNVSNNTSAILLKADKTYVDNQFKAVTSGAPKAVSLASQMTDTTKNYVYTGSESGYTAGNWYYYNGSAWVSGGVYQSTGIADKSLQVKHFAFPAIEGLTSKNLFDLRTVIAGYYCKYSTGALIANSGYSVTDYIPIQPSTNYRVSGTGEQGAFYDANKAYISGFTSATSVTVSPANAYYVRLSMLNSQVNSTQIELGTSVSQYENGQNKLDPNTLRDNSIPTTKFGFTPVVATTSKNLFNKATVYPGYYVNYQNGNLGGNSSYSSSDYIAVTAGLQYALQGTGEQFAFYNSNKTYVSGLATASVFTVPAGAAYVKLSMKNTQISAVQLEQGGVQTSYVPFGPVIKNEHINKDTADYLTDLAGVKVTTITKTVKPDGTGDYVSPKLANDGITDASATKVYNVIIYPGTYTDIGWTLKPYINLIGVDRKTCWLKGELPDNSSDNDITNTSTISLNSTNDLKNLTITARNMRYPVHDESSGAIKDWTRNIKNCHIEHYGNGGARTWRDNNPGSGMSSSTVWYSVCAYGMGISSGVQFSAEDTTFKSEFAPFSVHNNINFSNPTKITLRRCKMIKVNVGYSTCIRVESMGSGTDDKLILEGCQINGTIFHDDNPWSASATESTHLDFKIEGFGNSEVPYDSSFSTSELDRPNFTDEYNNFTATSDILKGQAVCYSTDMKTIRPMTNADDVSLFAGIAIENITNGSLGRVKIKGYVAKYDLYNFTGDIIFGTKYGINPSSSLVQNSNAVVIGADAYNVRII